MTPQAILEWANVGTTVLLLAVIIYKSTLIREHFKLRKDVALSAVILGYVISDIIDLICTAVFALNSSMRTVVGFSPFNWNSINPVLGIALRLGIILSSLIASLFAHSYFKKRRKEAEETVCRIAASLKQRSQ